MELDTETGRNKRESESNSGDGIDHILELRGVSRSFGSVEAVVGVDLELRRGEILGVVGDNGAGKTTLMKIVAGMVKVDEGEIRIDGQRVEINDAQDARRQGVEMIFQDLALFDNLDVAANVFIGREKTRGMPGVLGFLQKRQMHKEAKELLKRLNIDIASTKTKVGVLSGGQRQMVAIARALAFEESETILLMDEPSAALGATESATVNELITSINQAGLSIILISHRIPEVLSLAHRVLVMKRGRRVDIVDAATLTVEACVNLIVTGNDKTQ